MIVLYTKYSTISCSRSQFLTFVIIAVLLLLFLFNVLLFWLQQWNWAYDISIQWNKNTRNHMWVYMNSMHRLTNKSLLVFYFTFFFFLLLYSVCLKNTGEYNYNGNNKKSKTYILDAEHCANILYTYDRAVSFFMNLLFLFIRVTFNLFWAKRNI